MNIDYELHKLVQDIKWSVDVANGKSETDYVQEIKALFKHGTCKDCGAYNHCEITHYMGYLMSNFDENKDYCSKFWLDNESEQLPN